MKPKYITVFVVVILLLVLWWWTNPKQQNKQAVINQTGQEPIVQTKSKHQIKKKTQPITNETNSVVEWDLSISTSSDQLRSYMVVYHDLKFAKRCLPYYREEHEKKDMFDAERYLQEQMHNPWITTVEINAVQLNAFKDFIQACDILKKTTFVRAGIDKRYPDYIGEYPVLTELQSELEQTQAKTKAEQSLKQALQLKKQWEKLVPQLVVASKGEFVMTDAELQENRERIIELAEHMSPNEEGIDNIDIESMMALADEMQQIRTAMEETTAPDEERRSALLVEFQQLESQMQRLLNSPYLETFLVLMSALDFSDGFDLKVSTEYTKFQIKDMQKYVPEYVSPSSILKEMSVIPDSDYYNVLVEPAAKLYLCRRGYRCDETSDLITDYCFGSLDSLNLMTGQIHEQACGLSLQNFVEDYLLSENQKTDVMALLQLMEEAYGQ